MVSLMGYFSIPRDVMDIRMVYDAMKSGLNDVVWAPSFGLPTVDLTLRGIEFSTSLGEFSLGPQDSPVCQNRSYSICTAIGGDSCTSGGVTWECWERCLMGFKPSPYNAVRAFGWCKDIIQGYERDLDNPPRWDRVKLNLPCQTDYDPMVPWVSKTFSSNGSEQITRDFTTNMDDIWTCGQDEDHCWDVAQRVASYCGLLGIQQDAPHKR
jgi:hypothetical protein